MHIFIITILSFLILSPVTASHIVMPDILITPHDIAPCDPDIAKYQMTKLPYFSTAWQSQPNCDVYKRETVSAILLHFYAKWKRVFGDDDKKLWYEINRITIIWSLKTRTLKNVYDIQGNHLKEAEVIGLCEKLFYIWVVGNPETPILQTAFIHELVHYALYATIGTGDYDHEGDKVEGWTKQHTKFIIELKKEIKKTYDLPN